MYLITGQTATGKTTLAIEYAKKYNGELVNFDSRQIYKYLNIITGKDLDKGAKFNDQSSKFKLTNNGKNLSIGFYPIQPPTNPQPATNSHQPPTVNIWLYDLITPDHSFSSYNYVMIAQMVIDDIKKRGKTPILVGGSYFYLKHLLYGFDYQIPPDFKLREKLNKRSVKELQTILKKIDRQSFNQLNHSDQNNPRRLIRRIEISQAKNLTNRVTLKTTPQYRLTKFVGLYYQDRNKLRQKIEDRVKKRLKQGALDEVKKVLQMGYQKTDPGLKTIGYQQLIAYLEGRISKEKAIENWITAELQYAKRQYTFMKKDKNIHWQTIT